jgi:hypothetical protein
MGAFVFVAGHNYSFQMVKSTIQFGASEKLAPMYNDHNVFQPSPRKLNPLITLIPAMYSASHNVNGKLFFIVCHLTGLCFAFAVYM